MKQKFILFLVFAFPWFIHSQTYEFFNDIISKDADTVYVMSKFEPLEDSYINKYLTEEFIREEWEPLSTEDLPSMEEFLKNVDFREARKVAARQNTLDENIDFSLLDRRFIKVVDTELHQQKNKNLHIDEKPYFVLTRPIFNQNKDWAIVYYYGVSASDVANSGDIRIFRKVKDHWTFYWKVMIWIS